jgi:capsular exopolysaccharide synthesis family protein
MQGSVAQLGSSSLDNASAKNELARPEKSSRRNPHIAPVLEPGGNRSSLNDGVILLSRSSVVDLEAAERFRILRGQLERKQLSSKEKTPERVFAVTSATPGEGKSVTSVNLSRAFATDPRGKTLLIDCDLRKPNVHRFFGEHQGPGLSDVLVAGKPIRSVIRTVEGGLDVMCAGSPVIDSTRTIEQPGMALLLNELKKHYRHIILDCPPALFCSEPLALTQLATGTLLVARSWRTEKKLVKDAVNLIGRKALIGIVLNDSEDTIKQYGYYGYYGFDKEALSKAQKAAKKREEGRLSRILSKVCFWKK